MIKFLPAIYILFSLLGVYLTSLIDNLVIIPKQLSYISVLLIIISFYFLFSARKALEKRKTSLYSGQTPTYLETGGVYGLSRNPMYLAGLLLVIAFCLIERSLLVFIFPILYVVLFNSTTIAIEEKINKKTFGKAFLEYKRKVRRWI